MFTPKPTTENCDMWLPHTACDYTSHSSLCYVSEKCEGIEWRQCVVVFSLFHSANLLCCWNLGMAGMQKGLKLMPSEQDWLAVPSWEGCTSLDLEFLVLDSGKYIYKPWRVLNFVIWHNNMKKDCDGRIEAECSHQIPWAHVKLTCNVY